MTWTTVSLGHSVDFGGHSGGLLIVPQPPMAGAITPSEPSQAGGVGWDTSNQGPLGAALSREGQVGR